MVFFVFYSMEHVGSTRKNFSGETPDDRSAKKFFFRRRAAAFATGRIITTGGEETKKNEPRIESSLAVLELPENGSTDQTLLGVQGGALLLQEVPALGLEKPQGALPQPPRSSIRKYARDWFHRAANRSRPRHKDPLILWRVKGALYSAVHQAFLVRKEKKFFG